MAHYKFSYSEYMLPAEANGSLATSGGHAQGTLLGRGMLSVPVAVPPCSCLVKTRSSS